MSVEAVLQKMEAPAAATTAPVTPKAEPEEKTAAVPPADATPTVQPTEGQPTEETLEVEPELDLEAVPESSGDFPKYKPLFKDHPELRQILGREKAFSELGAFSEVRSIIERVPTITDAEQLVEDAENKRALGQTFRENPLQFAESLKESDPLAFSAFVKELPRVLAETAPELYTESARYFVNRAVDYLWNAAQQSGNQELATAVQLVASQGLGYQLGSSIVQPRAENSEAAKLRQKLQERDQADQESAFNSFFTQTDQAITDFGISSIEAEIKKALPDVSENALKRMVSESWDRSRSVMGAQPQTVAEVNRLLDAARKGKQSIADHKAIVNYSTSRAKLVIPKVVKEVIGEWTRDVLATNKKTIDQKKAVAATTRDVGSGPQGTSSAAAPSAPAHNGKPRGVNSIFAELESGAYVKR
jgi:hypothetical protein